MQKLADIKGLSDAKVEKLLDAARKLCPNHGWLSAKTVEQQRSKEIVKISLGAQAINELLGGGLESKCITEIYGEFRTGKTQICHTLCVTTQLPPEQGGGAGKVAYIDTEGTFRAEKIRAIAARFDLDADAVLDNLSEEFNVAVLITNQVVSDPSGGAMFVADPKKPVGGHVLAHASTIRISLRKGKAEQRLMKVVDAPNLPEAEASFQLSTEGVVDYKD
ncbi:g3172 [Coccomyxa elongata]